MVPHVKTHRSPWLTRHLVARGVTAFKTATPREVEMVLRGGREGGRLVLSDPGRRGHSQGHRRRGRVSRCAR
jgi:D-serine deaminase-like pyridoxal phosphate-dependent protein